MLIEPERLLTVVTRHHERFYLPALADAPPRSIVAQPENRGTAPVRMLAAAQSYVAIQGMQRVLCAKLHHDNSQRCIFRCSYGARAH